MSDSIVKLNLGGNEKLEGGIGSPPLEDFINVDINNWPGVDIISDVRKLPFDVESVDEIRASHIIEHFCFDESQQLIIYWASLLKKGGLLRLYCPDARKISEAFCMGYIESKEFSKKMFGAQTYSENYHKVAVDRKILNDWVEKANLKIIGMNPRPNAYPFDMGVQAIK